MSDLTLAVGKRLRYYRTRAGLSQERLSELAGCHPTYIGQVERGEKNLTVESLARICAGLGLPMAKLLEGLGDGGCADGGAAGQCRDMIERADPVTQERIKAIISLVVAIKSER